MQYDEFTPYFDLDLDAEQEIIFVDCTTGERYRYPNQLAMIRDLNPGLVSMYDTPADLIRDVYTDLVGDYDNDAEILRDLIA